MIATSDFVVNYGLVVILIIVAVVVASRYALANPNIRLAFDRRFMHLPLLGKLSRSSNTARYASTLAILTNSGVPLVDAMKIAGEVLSNQWLKSAVKSATQQVQEGSSLHKALERCGYFPPIMTSMVASGENSGDLDQMLERIAETQQRELDNLINTVIGIFEPAMLLFMGAAVLIIVVAILQPIFDLNALI